MTHRLKAEVGESHQIDLAIFTDPLGQRAMEPALLPRRLGVETIHQEGVTMLAKIAGAILGNRLAGRNSGAKGALMGAGVAALARRGLGPLATAAAVGYGAKKLWDWKNRRDAPSYPSSATPSSPRS